MAEFAQDLLGSRISRRRLGAHTAISAAALASPALLRQAAARAQESSDEFVVANEAEPASLLPWFGSFAQAFVARQVYETLVEPRMERDANGKVQTTFVPVLAERWERVDELRWRFYLRQGVTFHNGEPWNADAAIASYNVMSDTEITNQLAQFNTLRGTSGAEKVDDFTIEILTESPNSELLGEVLRFGLVGLPAGALQEQGVETFAEHPIGTGPYQFESWTRGEDLTLSRFDGYWDPNGPKMPKLRYVTRPEAAVRAQTVAAGEAQFAFNIGAEQATTLEHSVTGGGFQSSSLRINNQIAPTNDIRVRTAINLAIDRQAIVDGIFHGQAVPTAFFGFQPVTLEPYPYDPEQATALIEEAGATGSELELVYGEARIPEEDQLAEIYQASFEAIGLKIKLTKVEKAQYDDIGGLPFEQQPSLYMETTSSGNNSGIVRGLQDKAGCDGTGTYCDPAMDQAYLELFELDSEERAARLQEIAEKLHAEAARAWVAVVQQVHGLGPNVTTNFPLNSYIRFNDISTQ